MSYRQRCIMFKQLTLFVMERENFSSESEGSASSDPETVTSRSSTVRDYREVIMSEDIRTVLVQALSCHQNLGDNEASSIMKRIGRKVLKAIHKHLRNEHRYTVRIALFYGDLEERDHYLIREMYPRHDLRITYYSEHILCRVAIFWHLLSESSSSDESECGASH